MGPTLRVSRRFCSWLLDLCARPNRVQPSPGEAMLESMTCVQTPSSGKLEAEPGGPAPFSDATKSPPIHFKPRPPSELDGREERQMRGRVEEAASSLTYDKLFEFRERQRAMEGMAEIATVKRDVRAVRARMAAHGRYLLDPQVWYMQMWDIVILLAMMWTVFITPYEISFLPNANFGPTMNLIITSIFVRQLVSIP